MSKELVIAIVNLMFISACMGFLVCFFAMGGFNYQPKEENKFEGDMKASVGDYIITGVNGEQYPCKPDIFEKTYERIGETE